MVERFKARIGRHEVMVERSELERLFGIQLRDGNYSLVLAKEDRETQERDGIKPAEPKSHKPESKEPVIVPSAQPVITGYLEDNFYKFTMDQVRQVLTPDYLRFLRDSGYAPDLDRASGLAIEKGILRISKEVRAAAKDSGISITGRLNSYLVDINQTNGRRLVELSGYKLPTTAIMYKLFIPHIKELLEQGNKEAKKTLEEIVSKKAEWIEDVILDKSKIKIGGKEKQLVLPSGNGVYFNRSDINEFAHPNTVNQQQGEFRYWAPNRAENAVIRGRDFGLGLLCDWVPSDSFEDLGVRRANFFSIGN